MGGTGVSKNQVSRLCQAIDERVGVFLDRPTEGEWPSEGSHRSRLRWEPVLDRRDLRKVREAGRIVSDAHEGIKASVAEVMTATWQRCRVHFLRNVLAHAGRSGRRVV